MAEYDFVFAGGGLAGSSLAYYLASSPLGDSKMLILDRDDKTHDDRTWCFWTDRPTPFDGLVKREWSRLRFYGDGFEREIELGPFRYKLIRGADFYRFTHQALSRSPNVEFVSGSVETIEEGDDFARVSSGGRTFSGRWVFDSRFEFKNFLPDPRRYHFLPQYFKGWEIETTNPAFDPEAATLLDFRTPQKGAMRFFYVLPFSESRALVEYVTCGADKYDQALRAYIEETLGIGDYRIVGAEGGVNPMSDYTFPRRASAHVMNIGTRGGRIKPSTGYAFLRIQEDSAAILQSLLRHGHPFEVTPDSPRFRLHDSLMLDVMQSHGDEIKPIFTAFFKNNPIRRVFRFLDEKASLGEDIQVIASLPPKLFLQAMVGMAVNMNVRTPLL